MFRKFQSTSIRKSMVLALVLGLVGFSSTGNALAQRSDKETIVTMNAPFEIPGSNPQVLPAGTYLFRVVDNKSEPHIVQVASKDESKIYSTILSIPAHRDVATDKTVFTFLERAAGQPQAIRLWFYPNDTTGEEFIYPKVVAPPQVAAAAPVTPAPAAPRAPAQPAPAPPAVAETPRVAAETPVAPPPAAPTQAQQAPAPVVENPPQAAAPPPQAPEPPAKLPQTASNLPLLALLGLLSIGAALTVRRWTRH